jgi:segregation and condensation protein B
MDSQQLKTLLEALIGAAEHPLSVNQLFDLFTGDLDQPGKDEIRKALQELVEETAGRGMQIRQVASGFRLQVNPAYSDHVTRLFRQKPPRYSRALLETLALIAYRQPITRGEIEAIRGVSVSSNIIKTLQEREWVRTLGHKDVPGKPSLYGTTAQFLDYFNLKSLNELPTLSEIKDLDRFHPELAFSDDRPPEAAEEAGGAQGREADKAVTGTETGTAAPNAREDTAHAQVEALTGQDEVSS